MTTLTVLLLALSTTDLVAPQDPATLLVRANSHYAEGDHGRAAALYEKLQAAGIDNGHLWYNLGNCYLRLGNLGGAVAAYLRSQSLLPRNADVRANLTFARQSTKDAIEPRQSAAVVRTLFFWHFALSQREMLRVLVIANLLFWGLMALRLYRRDAEVLRWVWVGSLVVLIAASGSFGARLLWPPRVAVVQSQEIDVHSGTNRETVVTFKLHAGTEVEWLETRGAWLRIGLPDAKQGWVHHDDVVALTL